MICPMPPGDPPPHATIPLTGPLVAGILTYNRPAALVECVRHMAAQSRLPERLVIWNNGTAGTAAAALAGHSAPFPIEIIDSDANLGPTGGYHELVRTILSDPTVTSFYLIDDDCFMHPDNLRHLAGALEGDTTSAVAAIRGLHPKEVAEKGHLTDPMPTNSAGWCGSIYRAEVIRELGGPIRDLFFSYGEWEWSTRLLWNGWKLLAHPQARFEFLTSDDPRGQALRGKSMRDSHHRICYFKMRNATYMGLNLPHMKRKCSWMRRMEIYIASLAYSPDRAKTQKALTFAMEHGKAGKLGWVDVEALTK